MATVSFDTLRVFENFKSTGFTEEQARSLSEAIKEAQDFGSKDLTTKSDLQLLKSDLQLLKTELESKIDKLDTKIDNVSKNIRLEMKLYFLILAFLIILSNPRALDMISKMLGFVK